MKVKVLVVDDSRAMRMIVTRELREVDGVDAVVEAESAEAAIEVLGAEPVDLILCDWNMGGMTGLELLEALRSAGWTVPFGFVTSESSESIVSAALGAGAAFLVAKPFTAAELTAKVHAVLTGQQTTSAAGSAAALERPDALSELFGGLLRREVGVRAAAHGPERQAARWTADYTDTSGNVVAMCVVETPLATAMSGAFTMMPAATAEEWACSGTLPDALSEGFHEVTNVLAKAVHATGERCILREIAGYAPGEQLPEIDKVRAAKSAEHFNVAVEGYGGGLLSLVTF